MSTVVRLLCKKTFQRVNGKRCPSGLLLATHLAAPFFDAGAVTLARHVAAL